ncbi:MAG: hypothetical protein LBB75_06580 [Oscillospiraceae bacterium]|jgi:hypothetical protein|nr:hypothetical protein [Oscillospiraceae bacterium]
MMRVEIKRLSPALLGRRSIGTNVFGILQRRCDWLVQRGCQAELSRQKRAGGLGEINGRRREAAALLKAVCEHAAEHGYDVVEAYPGTNEDNSPHGHGNPSMYAKQGFELTQNSSAMQIARKKINFN